jgi:hypothetical protein
MIYAYHLNTNHVSYFEPYFSRRALAPSGLNERLDALTNLTYEDDSLRQEIAQQIEAMYPFSTLFLLVSPCTRAVQTAQAFGLALSSECLRVRIRIDDRIYTSCLKSSEERQAALKRFLQRLEAIELSTNKFTKTQELIDRQWLYQRLHRLESQDISSEELDPAHILDHFIIPRNFYTTMIVGEADFCTSFMQARPFPPVTRQPRDSDLYRLERSVRLWKNTYLGTYTQRPTSLLPDTVRAGGRGTDGYPMPSTVAMLSPSPSVAPSRKRPASVASINSDVESRKKQNISTAEESLGLNSADQLY